MKLASYTIDGRDSFGIVSGGGVIDLDRRVQSSTLRELIDSEPDAAFHYARESPDHSLSAITWRPPIPDPGMLICIGLNTYSHLEESRALRPDAAPPSRPWTFLRSPRSITGHEQVLMTPNASPLHDYEGEIALIIGKYARHVAPDKALDYVFGYSCFNEGSIRDFQLHSPLYTSGKNFPRSGSFGPWIVTADEIADVRKFELTTRVSGDVVQKMKYEDLIFDFADTIAYITSFTELHPGDVIATGTAAGVGAFRQPFFWLSPGDVCEVEVTGIGVLRNGIVEAQGQDRGAVTGNVEANTKEALALMKK